MKGLILFILTIFLVSIISASCSEGKIDINSASAEKLMNIKWVGNITAQRIIEARPFSSVDDLKRVSGFGGEGKRLADIKTEGLACVENESEEENKKEEKETENVNESSVQKDDLVVNNSLENNNLVVDNSENKTLELKPISLNFQSENSTKDIKSEENSQDLSKNKIARYGFFVFAVIIIILLIIRRNKEKKEIV